MTRLPDIDLTTYPEHQQFLERARRSGGSMDGTVCWLCRRPVKGKDPKMLQLSGGGFVVTDPNDPEVEQWHQAIGNGCLKKHPELIRYLTTKED